MISPDVLIHKRQVKIRRKNVLMFGCVLAYISSQTIVKTRTEGTCIPEGLTAVPLPGGAPATLDPGGLAAGGVPAGESDEQEEMERGLNVSHGWFPIRIIYFR